MDSTFQYYLKQVVDCPMREKVKTDSPCSKIITEQWATLLGWGNPLSKVLFVGINPHLNPEALKWHTPNKGQTRFEHVKNLSMEGASHARHFSYHKRILRELKSVNYNLSQHLPETIDEFAFYTEVAFCPSTDQSKLNDEIMSYCFKRNVKPFVEDSQFQIIIALGRIPSTICVQSLIGEHAVNELSNYHGKIFSLLSGKQFLITSYHPNAFGKWDRSAVSQLIKELYEQGKISFG